MALSAGVQRMVRSDVGASGVMFTMDTESGFDDAVFITSSYGLGEARRPGRGQPRRVLRLQAGAAGRPARRSSSAGVGEQGHQDGLHRATPTVGRTTEFVDVDPADRAAAQPHRRRGRASWPGTRSTIEEHYGRPMDIEWGKDGLDGELYILQARPETVQSRQAGRQRAALPARRAAGRVLVEGRAIGQKIGAGAVRVLTVDRRRCTSSAPATCWSPT